MLNLVIYEPEIPQNSGNMIRTCMATNINIHFIKPMGFSLDEQHLKRAGMDYIKEANIMIYENWEEFTSKNVSVNYFFLTRYGTKAPSQFNFSQLAGDIYLVVGKESTGIPKTLLKNYLGNCMRLPMVANARSLNVSNCAAIILYEVLRQRDYEGLSSVEVLKGQDFLIR